MRWGITAGVLDVLEGLLPTVAVPLLVNRLTAYVVGLAPVLGHVLSPYLRGRGDKGVATALGAVLALHPHFVVLALVVFAAGVGRLRSVGLGACVAAIAIGLLGPFAPMDPPVLAGRTWCVLSPWSC